MPIQEKELTFYYKNILTDTAATLQATSTSSTGVFAIGNINNGLTVNRWMASSSATQHIIFKGSTLESADSLVIQKHNLNTAGASITLQTSSATAFAGEETTSIASTAIGADTVQLFEFATVTPKANWRLSISGQTTAVYLGVVNIGTKTTVAFIQPPFSPHGQHDNSNVNMSHGGDITGVHKKFSEREFNINLNNSGTVVYNIVKDWHESHGMKNFFMRWDSTGTDVYHVRSDGRFNASYNADQLADITINLRGKKE